MIIPLPYVLAGFLKTFYYFGNKIPIEVKNETEWTDL